MERYARTSAAIGIMPARLLLAPASATWTLPFGAYLLFLSGRVALLRVKHQTLIGDHIQSSSRKSGIARTDISNPGETELGKTNFDSMNKTELGGGIEKTPTGKTEPSRGVTNAGSENPENPDPLFLANRCLTNYLETVPMAMILGLVAELNGANRRLLNYAFGALFLAKTAHIELGLLRAGTRGAGRPIGYYGGQTWMAGMAGYCGYLVRGYWWV